LYQSQTIGDDDCGAIGGMKIGKGLTGLTTLSRKRNGLLVGGPLLFTEYRLNSEILPTSKVGSDKFTASRFFLKISQCSFV
jgi:hypothetical protein